MIDLDELKDADGKKDKVIKVKRRKNESTRCF